MERTSLRTGTNLLIGLCDPARIPFFIGIRLARALVVALLLHVCSDHCQEGIHWKIRTRTSQH